jgi:hypothetical protein
MLPLKKISKLLVEFVIDEEIETMINEQKRVGKQSKISEKQSRVEVHSVHDDCGYKRKVANNEEKRRSNH